MPSANFGYTGAVVDWVVPTGVLSVVTECWGAEGLSGGGVNGGKGGYAKAIITVTPGETLKIRVGRRGQSTGTAFNGGGQGGGAGASDVRRSGNTLADRLVVGAGGGGYGWYSAGSQNLLHVIQGGNAGGLSGSNGGGGSASGKGGTQSAGGAAGLSGTAGTLGVGGNGYSGTQAPDDQWQAGGGGGGYYGGGGGGLQGGDIGGGGGGSSYTGGGTNAVNTAGVRTGDGLVTLTYEVVAPNTPTNVTPGSGATVNTDVPTLGMNLTLTGNILQRGEWQIATNSGFSANLKTITEPVADHKASGVTTQPVPSASQLFQGVWYIRGRAVSDTGLMSAWTAAHTFTVSHAPSTTNHSPTGGETRNYGDFGEVELTWQFSDTSSVDSQTAYQIQVSRNSDGLVLTDTGKVISSDQSYTATIDPSYKDVELRWRIRVWDSDDVVGTYSGYNTFFAGSVPIVNITSPIEAATVDSSDFEVTWDLALGGTKTQVEKRIRFAKVGEEFFYDTSWIADSIQSYAPEELSLENNSDYNVTVNVRDSSGLEGSDSNTFSTAWVAPDAPAFAYDPFLYDDEGYILIEWDNSVEDADYYSYRVYRRVFGDTDWKRIHETTLIATNHEYRDYTASSQETYEYAVVQVADRFGSLVESEYTPVQIQIKGTHYWLIDEYEPESSIKLYHVVSDSFTNEFEEESYTILGAGRHVDFGSELGVTGTLSCEVRDQPGVTAREQRQRVSVWKETRREVNLRTPFGDYWQVVASSIGFTRTAGAGVNEYGTLSIPYLEVGHHAHY